MSLKIIATGGTFDKHYDELTGQLSFTETHLPSLLTQARITLPVSIEVPLLIDSLQMDDNDRQTILHCCKSAPELAIVIIHGTDTMRETAEVLGAAQLAKTIVFTGAMVPSELSYSDALFNLGFACGVAQVLSHGVYVAMNGKIFSWDDVQKNKTLGQFTQRSV